VTRTRWHRDPDATPDLPAIRRQIPHPPLTSGDSLHAYAIIDFAGALHNPERSKYKDHHSSVTESRQLAP
ncbi:MAG TPA: hypothetical protein VGS06_41705, partial [Streptosporangiaceae bacterium]|nr:hypothetical protein [Streptosporangiaceae bacterium]